MHVMSCVVRSMPGMTLSGVALRRGCVLLALDLIDGRPVAVTPGDGDADETLAAGVRDALSTVVRDYPALLNSVSDEPLMSVQVRSVVRHCPAHAHSNRVVLCLGYPAETWRIDCTGKSLACVEFCDVLVCRLAMRTTWACGMPMRARTLAWIHQPHPAQ